MIKVFIDGQEGTTGLELENRLRLRPDVELVVIDPERRKDPEARQKCMAKADVVFLCLPDGAAREAAALCPGDTVLIDASTAHRTAEGWAYGLPELSPEYERAVREGRRIAVPGCHAAGFALAIYPLVSSGLLDRGHRITCFSLTGYSGGGKKMIEEYTTGRVAEDKLHAPRPYALGLSHKHLPEMQAVSTLRKAPHFVPIVGDFLRGMLVSVPFFAENLKGAADITAKSLHELYQKHYEGQDFVRVMPLGGEGALDNGFLDPMGCNGTNRADIFIFGGEDHIMVTTRLDNLGKGASGAAVQCMNLAMGLSATAYLA